MVYLLFSWLICESRDDKTQPDLSRAKWLFEVVLDYGEHDVVNPTPDDAGQWPVRDDPFSTYRAGFEMRTYRLCRRVLMFHRFIELVPEMDDTACLVRSTNFDHTKTSVASFLNSVTQSGYLRQNEGAYLKKSLPPLEFGYIRASVSDQVKTIDAVDLENLPMGVDGSVYQWVDLDSEGLSGVLTEQAGAWFYKRNLGNGRLAPEERISKLASIAVLDTMPSLANLAGGAQQLMSLANDGRLNLVQFAPPLSGYYERTNEGQWESFRPFHSNPNINWQDPNLRFVDLTGDGFPDILISEDDLFVWHPSLLKEGFGPAEWVREVQEEDRGPALVFADATQSIFLADMSSDGLTDIVRIRNGEICDWPNLGYGRFGAKITMSRAPFFDHPDQFNPNRIRLADIDGSGTTDNPKLKTNTPSFWSPKAKPSSSSSSESFALPHQGQLLAFCVPHNDKLLSYWDTVADRLFKIRHCMNIEGVVRQLPLFEPPIDPALLVRAAAAVIDISSVLNDINAPVPHYRFNVMVQKANELCVEVKSLGVMLLSTLEKRDAEALSLLRSTHEIEILNAVREIKRQQINEAHETLEGLRNYKKVVLARQLFYSSRTIKIPEEQQQLDLLGETLILQWIQQLLEIGVSISHLIPDFKVGSPTTVGTTYGGSNLGSALQSFAGSLGANIARLNTIGTMSGLEASYLRRKEDWDHQADLAGKELKQVDKQIIAGEIRLAIAENELENHDRQIENAKEVDEFMRSKFTNQQLYNWMVGQISSLYFRSYQLAYDVAKRAERTYRYELGLQDSNFIQFGYWDSLKKGLLAGEL